MTAKRPVASLLLARCIVPALAMLGAVRAAEPAGGAPTPPVRYMIVVTGDELLEGAFADTHTVFLTRTFFPRGLKCAGSLCVGDSAPEILDALRFATERAELVIITGGLGPTDHDITRETLRDFTGIPLQEHPEVLAGMARRFNVAAGALRPNLRRQAQVPTRGGYLRNPTGTAVGLVFETDRHVIVALPGPPRELQPMVREELAPYVERRFGTQPPGASLTLRFVGLGESQIVHTITTHAAPPEKVNPWSRFEGGRVDFTFALPADTPEDRTRLADFKNRVVRHLGDHIYADDPATTLEMHVARLLESRGTTLAVAEIGSGGDLVAAIHRTAAEHPVLAGAYVAPTAERLRQMLGTPCPADGDGDGARDVGIERLARDLAAIAASGCAVVVGERLRDGGGGAFVDVAFRLPDHRVETRRLRLAGPEDFARAALVTSLLDQMRRMLR